MARIMRTTIIVAVVVLAALAHASIADTLTCSTWNGIRTCSSPNGYVSHETEWQGFKTGDDNQGNRWTTSRWRDIETTTVTPPQR
jgi:hypothetical protein